MTSEHVLVKCGSENVGKLVGLSVGKSVGSNEGALESEGACDDEGELEGVSDGAREVLGEVEGDTEADGESENVGPGSFRRNICSAFRRNGVCSAIASTKRMWTTASILKSAAMVDGNFNLSEF